MICTGAKSEKLARSAIKKTVRLLRENGVVLLSEVQIEIVNVVATVDLGIGVNLEMTERALGDVMYEPERARREKSSRYVPEGYICSMSS